MEEDVRCIDLKEKLRRLLKRKKYDEAKKLCEEVVKCEEAIQDDAWFPTLHKSADIARNTLVILHHATKMF